MGMIINTSPTVACKAVQLDNTQSCIDFLIYIGMAAVGAFASPGIQKSETRNTADGAAWPLYPNKRGTRMRRPPSHLVYVIIYIFINAGGPYDLQNKGFFKEEDVCPACDAT